MTQVAIPLHLSHCDLALSRAGGGAEEAESTGAGVPRSRCSLLNFNALHPQGLTMRTPMDRALLTPRNTDCMSRDYIVATSPTRNGNEALPLAIDLTTFELRQRQNEWRRHGREDLAEAFRRIETAVSAIEI